jgi:Haem-binding domain
MKRPQAKWIIIGVLVVLALIQLIPPSRTNPPVVASRSLAAHMEVPPDVQAVYKRACYDCHSNETVWPRYSHVAPVSWYVAHDVNVGRRHVNFQDWEAQENQEEALEHLGLTCKLMQEGKMPPSDYLLMHKNADVSQADINTVCAWTQKVAPPEEEGGEDHHDHDHHDHNHDDHNDKN